MDTAPREGDVPAGEKRKRNPLLVFGVGMAAYLLFGLGVGLLLNWYIDPQESTEKKDLIQALGLIMAGVAGAIGIYSTWQNFQQGRESLRVTREGQRSTQLSTQESLELTRKGQITERFTKAVDQLGDDKIQIRLGGIYALGRIAEDSKEYHWPIVEVLTAYVRGQAPYEPERQEEGRADIQAILTVIGQLTHRYGARKNERVVNLCFTDLFALDLTGLHLEGAFLAGAHLERANFTYAHLREADLRGTHLEGARLWDADLENADLRGAHLDGAYVSSKDTKLAGANLGGTDIRWADFGMMNLQEIKNLTQGQIEHANGDWQTVPPSDCQAPAWWSVLPPIDDPISPGDYSIKVCKTAMCFRIGEGWYSSLRLPYAFFLTPGGVTYGGSTLSFSNVQRVYDPDKPEDVTTRPKPDDMVEWLFEHPSLKVRNPQEVQIGGASGTQVDVIVRPGLDKYLSVIHRPSIPLFPLSRADPFVLGEGYEMQLIVLDVNGETIIIVIQSLPDEFDEFFARAREILATVTWEGSP